MKRLLLALLCLNFGFADEFREIKSEFFEGKTYLKALKIDESLSSGIVKFEKGARTHAHPKKDRS
ncbi:hypothetical protein DMB92_03725 [Campylobacter sp. MIT 99-7217]|uniref:hypothetical protein n=1 Tax=Campylobacter sp. MIT 99-7217 TaxID=535091 RepID=UPI0011580550|nr:hypothetical protein [Campylobacter sp. MIT 99-7217]TQR33078.1 hypothetical protein DMB92_03725 [Campylobacter sp. MIT 99-7217]